MADEGYRQHYIRKGDGIGGWELLPAQYRMIWGPSDGCLMPYGIAWMDNGETILLAGMQDQGEYRCVYALSGDEGASWSDMSDTGSYGRPLTFGYLGGGNLVFGNELLGKPEDQKRKLRLSFSSDYGRSWNERVYPMQTQDGRGSNTTEGTVFAEQVDGATRICHLSVSLDPKQWDRLPSRVYMRWSNDLGSSWHGENCPQEWLFEETCGGKRVPRGVSEGSLVRAQNGWLVAALRTDLPTRYWDVPHDDSLEGVGVSISKDNGTSWSPINVLYDAGRHHPNLILMPNGDLVMTLIVRADVVGGELASYRRGSDALVSHDNGASWNLQQQYVLDAYEFSDSKEWYNGECGHLGSTRLSDGSILTVYGNYLSGNAALIKWRPSGG